MYELVNTSLPNGLIPGSHGFAAVAMTKGLPDALRTRLESYCAYSHRTSTHDATYFTENPVNWFHVTLPQGDHVLGRVAPADFDYTGRTNRLARLLVFSKNEMPAIGGASVLKKESARLSEAWSGEVRWLESDKLTVGRLRLEFPPTNCDAPSWRAMFGNAEGLNLARGFARLLAKNLSTTGRTIYFKTSTAFDGDGTKLLALFADLIDLLPVVDRRSVTFSTYPVALPQGTLCHLRGVYDRDRVFDASATTQPWVDCEKGVVHNASLLPLEEVKQRKLEPRGNEAPVRTPQQPTTYGARQQTVPAWMPPQKKDGTKSLVIGIIAITTILVVTAIACGIFLLRKTARSVALSDKEKVASRLSQGVQDKGLNGTPGGTVISPVPIQGESDGSVTKANHTTKFSGPTKINTDAKSNVDVEVSVDIAKAKAKSEKVPSRRPSVLEVVKKVRQIRSNIEVEWTDSRDKKQMTNGTLKVFYYDEMGVLTNQIAGFKPKAYIMEPKPKDIVTSGIFLIWVDVRKDKNTAYWDWLPMRQKTFEPWFKTAETVDLMDKCFGLDDAVRKTWGKKWDKESEQCTFSIEVEIESEKDGKKEQQLLPPFPNLDLLTKSRPLTLNEVVQIISDSDKDCKRKNDEASACKNTIDKLERQKRIVSVAEAAYAGLTNQIMRVKGSQKKKGKEGEIKNLEKKIDRLWKGNDGQNPEEKLCNNNGLDGVYLSYEDKRITNWEEVLDRLNKGIANKKQELIQKNAAAQEARRRIGEKVKNSGFRINKVERETK